MKVRALGSYVDEVGRHSAGDVYVMEDGPAVERIKAGLVRRVEDQPLTATMPEPELAVSRRRRA